MEDTGDEGDTATDLAVETFELIGSWDYMGGFAGLTDQLLISEDQMADSGDYNGTGWTIVFSIESWDNDANQSLLEVSEIEGFSHYPLGAPLYLSWQLAEDILTLYTGATDFLEPSGGTEGNEFFTYSRL